MSERVLILGATSAIARATAAAFAARGAALYLASRDGDELQRIAADLRLRYGVEVHYGLFDAELTESHEAFFKSVVQDMHYLSGVVLAFGYLGDQQAARDFNVGCQGDCQQLYRRRLYPESLRELLRDFAERLHHRYFFGGGRSWQAKQLCVWCRERRT